MNIDFSTDRYVCGEFGEHNAESLVVSIPQDMQNAGSAYRLAFLGVASLSPVRTHPLTPENNKVTYPLPQSVTSMREADMTLEEYNGDDLLRKSTMVRLVFNCAVPDGEDEVSEDSTLVEEITANTAARHTHSNKAVLDELGEDENGDLTYKGDGFATDSELALKQDILTAGANITITGTTISADIDNTREIAQLDNPYRSVYTPAQLKAFDDEGLLLTYTASPILWAAYDSAHNEFHFAYAYPNRNNNTISYYCDCYVNASKTITLSTVRRTPYSVNTKTPANATGDITLVAGDISAAAGWTPSNDTDIATKKYVDDSIPTIPVTDVQDSNGTSLVSGTVASIPQIPDISGCEVTANKVTALSAASTDTQYPSAKCVYDIIGDVESILADLIGGA